MKQNFLLLAIVIIVAFVSCNSKNNNKEQIVSKWHLTNLSGKGSEWLPDSVKAKMYNEGIIEFKANGNFETAGITPGNNSGTYQFSADGNSLITTGKGSTNSDTLKILELSSGKLVILDSKGDIKISLRSH